MGGDHAHKAASAFAFSLGCEADGKWTVVDEVKKI